MNTQNAIHIIGNHTVKVFKLKKIIGIASLALFTGFAHAKNEKEWTGPYGGINIGGLFNSVELNANNLGFTKPDGTCNTHATFSSFFPGVQAGYAGKINSRIVLGVEADYTNNINKQGGTNCTCDVNPGVSDSFLIKNQQQGSLRGRVGYSLNNNVLPFLTVGGSLASVGVSYQNEGGDYYSNDTTALAWLVGAGLEWKFAPAWSIRAEYFYSAYDDLNLPIPRVYGLSDQHGQARVNMDTNNLRAAINYWF